MEHLDIPEEHRCRAITIPYLGIAPAYDKRGFSDFAERYGFHRSVLPTYTKHSFEAREDGELLPFTAEFIQSFFQEWLWFGALHEFQLACGLPLDIESFIKPGADGRRIVSTEGLLPYVRSVVVDQLLKHDVPLDLKAGDWVYIKRLNPPDSDTASSGWETEDDESSKSVWSEPGSVEPESPEDVSSYLGSTPFMPSSIRTEFIDTYSEPRQILKDLGNLSYSFQEDYSDVDYAWRASSFRRAGKDRESTALADVLPSLEGISLRSLIGLLKDAQSSPTDRHQVIRSRFAACLREVRRTTRIAFSHYDTIHRFEVALSIDILCDSLREVWLNIFQETMEFGAASSVYYTGNFGARMIAGNWCLARSESVLASNLVAMYFKSVLLSHESTSHKGCGPISCSQQSHDVNSLQAEHDVDTCDGNCPLQTFFEQKLIDILQSDGIPGISKIDDEGGTAAYEIVDVTGRDYIAISHVWAHGLGNPDQNALPLCQVRRLFKYIQQIGPPDVVLWIDTLTVPVNLKYKRIAIMKLRDVYEQARGVLVIDHHLIRVGKHTLERRIQLLCSEWMRRLWTLQEGRLASNLYVQFHDEAIPISYLSNTDVELTIETDPFIFQDLRLHAGLAVRLHFAKREHLTRRFVDLAIDMAHRSVTVPTDEPICLATMLGLPLEQFKPYPTMVDIYRSLPVLPPDLLFLQNPKMENPGFRWAPRTFLNQGFIVSEHIPGDDPALLMPSGLQLRRNCIIFKDPLYFHPHREEYLARDATSGNIPFLFYQIQGRPEMRTYENAAIILNQVGGGFEGYTRGVVVSGLVDREGVWCGRFEIHLMVRKWNGLTEQGAEMLVYDEDEDFTFDGEFREEVTFCVD